MRDEPVTVLVNEVEKLHKIMNDGGSFQASKLARVEKGVNEGEHPINDEVLICLREEIRLRKIANVFLSLRRRNLPYRDLVLLLPLLGILSSSCDSIEYICNRF